MEVAKRHVKGRKLSQVLSLVDVKVEEKIEAWNSKTNVLIPGLSNNCRLKNLPQAPHSDKNQLCLNRNDAFGNCR